jgi:hypothetical protein
MFTFTREISDDFVPVLHRFDGITFSMEWIQDMKALGLDAEAEIQNPNATGKPFIKVAENGGLKFYDANTGQEVKRKSGLVVKVPESVKDQLDNSSIV